MASDKLYGLVLAGGKSRRMGQDKALLLREGQSQLSYIATLLERVAVACRKGRVETEHFMLLLFSYAFMLRVPSEAVPATFCGGSFSSACAHAVSLTPSRLGVRLAKRNARQL